MEKSIRVRIMNLEYPLRVRPEDEELAHEVAAYVDSKIEAVRKNFPSQSTITATVLAALSIAEEYFSLQQLIQSQQNQRTTLISDLTHQLTSTLSQSETEPESNPDAE